MSRKSVVLGLFADRVDILSLAGSAIAGARRIPLTLGNEAGPWLKAVAAAGTQLRAAVEELDLVGAPAIVLYRNPTACADYASLSIRSASEAREAAILGCAESLTCPMDEASCTGMVIGRDAGGSDPQTHVVIAADHELAVAAIAELVEAADLKFEFATPLDAAIMARQGGQGLSSRTANRACLYVGEHRSFLVISNEGALVFARAIGLGIDSLITSLTRPIRVSPSAQPIELNHDAARSILHRFGFPQREQIIDESLGLTGGQIIPVLQPVLQRFIVELRQSLRFAVQEEQRHGVEMNVTGPGCAIPNFGALIAGELHLTVTTDHRYADNDGENPASDHSELLDACKDYKALPKLGLLPRKVAHSRHMNRLRRWLYAGAAAAVVMVAMDFVHYHKRVSQLREQVDLVQAQVSDLKALQTTGERLFAVIADMEKLENLINTETGAAINMRACLQELSIVTPPTVRLSSIAFFHDKGATLGRFNGYAFEGGAGGRTELEPFVDRLKKSPLFADVALSNVQAVSRGQAAGQQFELNLTAIGAPRSTVTTVVSAGDAAISQGMNQ